MNTKPHYTHYTHYTTLYTLFTTLQIAEKVQGDWEQIPPVPQHCTDLKASVGAELNVWRTKQNTLMKTGTFRK